MQLCVLNQWTVHTFYCTVLIHLNMLTKHLQWKEVVMLLPHVPWCKDIHLNNPSLSLLVPHPNLKVCTLGMSMWCKHSALCQRDRGKKQNGMANKRACIQAGPGHCPTRGPPSNVRRSGFPPPTRLEEPNRKSKFSGRMGRAQSSSPLGPAERGVKKELLRACRRLMQWIVFLLPASVSP